MDAADIDACQHTEAECTPQRSFCHKATTIQQTCNTQEVKQPLTGLFEVEKSCGLFAHMRETSHASSHSNVAWNLHEINH